MRCWLEIDIDAVLNNYKTARKNLRSDELIAVVKGDAYGLGAVKIAKVLSRAGCKTFAVASYEEALCLRRVGITNEILILGYTDPKKLSMLIKHNLTQAVFSTSYFLNLQKARTRTLYFADKLNIQLKIDSGMNRLGFNPTHEKTFSELLYISADTNFEITGIFSHFSCSDDDTELGTRRIKEQTYIFYKLVNDLTSFGVTPRSIHIANSRGAVKYALPCNAVRFGACLYGINLAKEKLTTDIIDKITPQKFGEVATLMCRIAQIKQVEKGENIGYGNETIAKNDMKIAIVTIGYADGYPRSLSDKGLMLVGKNLVPVIGKVCMDMTILDITGIIAKEGDPVIVWGKKSPLSLACHAKLADTIDYELLCRLSPRVKRKYITLG